MSVLSLRLLNQIDKSFDELLEEFDIAARATERRRDFSTANNRKVITYVRPSSSSDTKYLHKKKYLRDIVCLRNCLATRHFYEAGGLL